MGEGRAEHGEQSPGVGKRSGGAAGGAAYLCPCGNSFRLPATFAGHEIKCDRCNRVGLVRPVSEPVLPKNGESIAPPARVGNPGHGPAAGRRFEAFCSICQCQIEVSEAKTACFVCGLPFHDECWHANGGCSAYGCAAVDFLKPVRGPQVAPPHPQPSEPLPQGATSSRAGGHSRSDDEAPPPWEALLLGCTVGASLAGLLAFGAPCLLTGLCAVWRLTRGPRPGPAVVLVLCLVLSGVGFVAGVLGSGILWLK